jgi:hypothetical protein
VEKPCRLIAGIMRRINQSLFDVRGIYFVPPVELA